MKNKLSVIFFTFLMLLISTGRAIAIEFDVAVIPTDVFSSCDNYFCFPEVSEIVAQDVISSLNQYKGIKARSLAQTRIDINSSPNIKQKTKQMLDLYANSDKVDFSLVREISNALGVKSLILITSYTTTDKALVRRNLWTMLELTNAFKTTYPISLNTNAVLTDSVNGIIMWSGKYSKSINDSNGHFQAKNQTQAFSHLERFKLYSKDNISKSISQNVHMRFFPPEVKTIELNKNKSEKTNYVPNMLEHLSEPKIPEPQSSNELDYTYFEDTFMF